MYDVYLGAVAAGLNLTVTGDVEVATSGRINVDARGYGGNLGTGNGGEAGTPMSGGGAGHGGYGGLSSSNAAGGISYGSIEQPTTLGSGGGAGSIGGPGGAGGGAIKLTVSGTVNINGVVSANGANGVNSRSGGGAGGSIWITAQTLTGSGTISVNGGKGEPIHGGGGAGGRLALTGSTNTFSGNVTAYGGAGFQLGGAGTIYSRPGTASDAWVTTIANGGATGAITPFNSVGAPVLWVRGGAVAAVSGIQYVQSLSVESNSWLTCMPTATQIEMTVWSNAVFAAGSGINLRGKGYAYGQGNGPGLFYSSGANGSSGGGGGNAGYGGMGAATNLSRGGIYYGTVTGAAAGSGGGGNSSYPGGSGGGILLLTVTKTLQFDGSIIADGERPVSNLAGGGSGGSVRLTVGTLSGAGSISANGGSAYLPNGGGGSGGRIAVYFDTNLFTGTFMAAGGTGFQNGAAGTIYTTTNGASVAHLTLNNGGVPGTNTFLTSAGTVDLTVQGGAVAGGITSFRNLTIRSNSALALTGQSQTLTVSGDARIESGGTLSMDGLGYIYNQGSGSGRYYNSGYSYSSGGSGGGHGGYGGDGVPGKSSAPGGNAYDTLTTPNQTGSGGGGSSAYPGGSGGGYLRLTVNGLLQLDGRISANGLPASAGGAGGGSGGSVWLTLGKFSGTGVLSANGGDGDLPNGGGGGGGRIAVTYPSNNNAFTGTLTARGGAGFVAGGAGTLYLKGNSDTYAQVTLDNGGLRGAGTPLNSLSPSDLTLRGGACVSNTTYSSYGMNLRNLFIGSNSWYYLYGTSYDSWTVTGNATLEAAGGISGDGRGGMAGQGTGPGHYYNSTPNPSGGGGGHGGYGGHGAFGGTSSAGGTAYDTAMTQPTSAGSGGGAYYSYTTSEGAGGSPFRLVVTGLLRLDGAISVNGLPGLTSGSGGGAGGSLWLTVGGLSGAGLLAANGGAGDLPNGGGGGGGRIAVTWTSNSFTGSISAKGGNGYVAGGAGTIYADGFRDNYNGTLLVDNGGLRGTDTLVCPYSPKGDLIVQGGAVAVPSTSLSVSSLAVFTNSGIMMSNQTLTISGNATVQAGASVHANGTGYGPGSGPGAGSHGQNPKGGGSHAGWGGANPLAVASGSVTSPTSWGSGGGNGSGSMSPAPYGGAGGGAVRLNVTRQLTVDGRISANGTDGGVNSGGGAGGSVWLTVGTLAGTGTISANGGAGNGTAGGGGGGRVSLQLNTNLFSGSVTAFGGAGSVAGGAGTVYWQPTGSTNKWLVVNNGDFAGNNTPLYSLPSGLDLTVVNGAIVHPQDTFPLLNSVHIGSGGVITHLATQTKLEVATVGDLTIESGGGLAVDGKGYAHDSGTGAGATLSSQGGGGGYGGAGGDSMTGAPGGPTYGSAVQPVDRGSGGGAGSGPFFGGSEGGGAIRLTVGGTLTVNGWFSASGMEGWQDNSGGGSGGSIWVTTRLLTGNGLFSADGGSGELFGGGGGGGGRIAVYRLSNPHTNRFSGDMTAYGGAGDWWGDDGTIFIASTPGALQVVGQTPAGIVSNVVSSVDFLFNSVVNPLTATNTDVVLVTPGGILPQTDLVVSTLGLDGLRISFPPQTAVGGYTLRVGPQIEDLLGQAMSQVYTGAFTVVLPTISGRVTNTNGLPVAGVVLQPSNLSSLEI
jgi:hypothetical protein